MSKTDTFRHAVREELDRYALLWCYQHKIPSLDYYWRQCLKRGFDILGSGIGLVVLAPLMALIALLVKATSEGPALYIQERCGLNGKPFMLCKFRSMRTDAETHGPQWAQSGRDPRSTAIGHFLRRTHLDELPQLWNVFCGEMSLVGPRPERPVFTQTLKQQIPGYVRRMWVKPGITGLAQVRYRCDQSLRDVRNKVRFDLLYMRRSCLLLDMRILAWTLMVCITGRLID